MKPLRQNRRSRSLYVLALIALVMISSLALPLMRGASPIDLGLDLSGGVIVSYRPDFDSRLDAHSGTSNSELLALAKETLESRLYRSLSTVPEVVVRGGETIEVSIPARQDYKEILELVGKTYHLTLRLVTDAEAQASDSGSAGLFPYQGRLLALAPAEFSGDMFDARSLRVETGAMDPLDPSAAAPHVAFSFQPPHDDAFARFTGAHVGEELAILLDDEVEWVGRIESAISGSGVLRGSYNLAEANALVDMLRSGSLPVTLEMEGLASVGPTLGQEIQEKGALALALSLGLLLLLLTVAYLHRSGFLLAGALSLLNLLLYIGGLVSLFDLTLDMVGIAGLVLSVGMGMDAFILIFESLDRKLGAFTREQIVGHHDRIVRGLYSFLQEGRVLFHANATTAVVVMLLLGSERLKSFAVFIFVGILASVLTIFTTRAILERSRLEGARLDLLGWLRGKQPGIFRARRLYFAAVAVVLVGTLGLGLAAPGWGPSLGLGADFQEGARLEVESLDDGALDRALIQLEERLPGVEIRQQSLGEPVDGRFLISLGTALAGSQTGGADLAATDDSERPDQITVAELTRLLADEGVDLESASSVDSRLSASRTLESLSVLILSFVFLALYFVVLQGPINSLLAKRTARPLPTTSKLLAFGGVLLAVVVDVTLLAAFAAWLRLDTGLPVVAALLTIIGYSVNDSVVLWSHVRNRHQAAKKSEPVEIVTRGVDSILSRALLTSLSTLVPAVAILIVGLRPLESFAWMMLAGTVFGTLSSIFVVGSFAVMALRRAARPPLRARVQGKASKTVGLSRAEIARRLQEAE